MAFRNVIWRNANHGFFKICNFTGFQTIFIYFYELLQIPIYNRNSHFIMNTQSLKQIQENFDAMNKVRKNRRSQEEIINDINIILAKGTKESILPFTVQMMNFLQFREELSFLKNLKSPLKQLTYLLDLFLAINDFSDTKMEDNEWVKLTELLDEVEMSYFGDIGFFGEDSDNFDLEKISVSLKAFFDYYCNGQLSYNEQTANRIVSNFSNFDSDIYNEFSFKTQDIVDFYLSLSSIQQNKLDRATYYERNRDEWLKLTSKFLERGIDDPYDWGDQPELFDMVSFRKRPGHVFILSESELELFSLNIDTVKSLIKFLKYDEEINKGKTVYYSDESEYTRRPIIELNEDEYLFPNGKFILEACYNRISAYLGELKKEKYTQFKNSQLEVKTLDVFQRFFTKDANYFTTFYFDKQLKSEQDLAILVNKTLLIIEIKDFKFRAPMRNPIKAFDKIKSDFKVGIQRAYEQCKRMEDKLSSGIPFKIYDLNTSKELHEIKPNSINNYYSIIVTQHKYGAIQTNLQDLLVKDEDDLYPWSICIDDLEIFLSALKKIKGKKAATEFFKFLDNREPYHERLICSDELEMAGFYLVSPQKFIQFADREEILSTHNKMSDLFDAHYECGLGLRNEFNLEIKRKNPLRAFAKNFDMDIITGKDLKNNKN